MTEWFESFFAGPYLELYNALVSPEATAFQAEAVWRWLSLSPGDQVLDLCCGQGRHSIALASRGAAVTGQDLSAHMLARAGEAAERAGVQVTWRQGDMREVPGTDRFDAVISLFSSFGYFLEDDANVAVLQGIARALKPGGRLLLDINNREAAILGGGFQRVWEPQPDGRILLEEREYEVLSGRMRVRVAWADQHEQAIDQWLRLYTLPELVHLIRGVGLATTGAWGDYDGSDYTLGSPRLILRAVKPDL